MSGYLAVKQVLEARPSAWPVVPVGRLATLTKLANADSSAELLALRSNGRVEARTEMGGLGRQAPSEGTISSYWLVEQNQLIVNPMWLVGGSIGVSDICGAVSPAYRVYRLSTKVVPRFVHHLLRSAPYMKQYQLLGRGDTTFDRSVGREDFEGIPVPVPSPKEQVQIADFLDDQVSRLDTIITRRQQQLDALAEWTLAAVSDALAPPARFGDGRPDALWLSHTVGALTKLSSVCLLQSGVTVDASRTVGSEYPYLRVANVQNGSINLDEVKRIVVPAEVARRTLLRAGDVLMTEGGDIDKLGRGSVWHAEIDPCLHQNHVFALRPDRSALLPEYLAAMTRTHHARCYFESTGSQSTNLASTNSSKVLAFRFPLPSLAAQEAKLRDVRANDEQADRLKTALQKQIELLQERKQGLITAAVTGQLDVTTARAAA